MSYYSYENEQDRLQKLLEECLAENDDEQIEIVDNESEEEETNIEERLESSESEKEVLDVDGAIFYW